MPKVICITGATAGVGWATALRFAGEGWNVIVTGRRQERLEELAKMIGPSCLPLCLDVGDRAAVEKAFAGLTAPFAPIDVLVNNAGCAFGREPAQECLMDDWEAMVDTNIMGVLYCTRAVIGDMAARKSGQIVNISSIAGFTTYRGANVYGASKAFVKQFSQNLRADLHGTGVRVNDIEPGNMETEFSLVRFKGDAAQAKAVYAGLDPLVAENIADAIWFVVSAPPHVNINRMEIMPVCQSQGGTVFFRK